MPTFAKKSRKSELCPEIPVLTAEGTTQSPNEITHAIFFKIMGKAHQSSNTQVDMEGEGLPVTQERSVEKNVDRAYRILRLIKCPSP